MDQTSQNNVLINIAQEPIGQILMPFLSSLDNLQYKDEYMFLQKGVDNFESTKYANFW